MWRCYLTIIVLVVGASSYPHHGESHGVWRPNGNHGHQNGTPPSELSSSQDPKDELTTIQADLDEDDIIRRDNDDAEDFMDDHHVYAEESETRQKRDDDSDEEDDDHNSEESNVDDDSDSDEELSTLVIINDYPQEIQDVSPSGNVA